MGFIEKTERKFGKFAVTGLSLKLVVFQCLIFLLMTSSSLQEIESHIKIINIPGTHIISDFLLLAGLPVCFPSSMLDFLMLFFGSYILVMCGNMLESLWGTYKFNLYVLTYLVLGTVALQVFRATSGYGIVEASYVPSAVTRFNILSLLHMAMFIGCAINFPRFEILAFFILPVSFKFIAILEVGITLLIVFNCPTVPLMAFFILTILGPPFLFHYKQFLQNKVQQARTAEFQKKVAASEKQAFHKCATCGKTEHDGDLEFRIAKDGEEYCLEHLPKK